MAQPWLVAFRAPLNVEIWRGQIAFREAWYAMHVELWPGGAALLSDQVTCLEIFVASVQVGTRRLLNETSILSAGSNS